MHEMGICQSILSASFDAAADAGFTRITDIYITVGELTEIQEFALQFAFEALTPGTMAEGGTLHVKNLSPRSRCTECGHEYSHDRFEMVCPECGSFAVELLQGRELTIDSIEAADEDGDEGAESPESALGDAGPAPASSESEE